MLMPRAVALVALAAVLPALAVATVGPDVDRRLIRPMPMAGHMCGTQGRYAPGSAYEANLRRVAARVAAEVNANPCNCSSGSVAGDRPDQVSASAFCYLRRGEGAAGSESSDCGACVALAFREAWRRCLYHRQAVAVVDGGACSVSFHDVHRMEQQQRETRHHHVVSYDAECTWLPWICNAAGFMDPDALVVLMFQAAGLACVVFLFLQEWRARSRGPTIHCHSNDYLLVTGDQ